MTNVECAVLPNAFAIAGKLILNLWCASTVTSSRALVTSSSRNDSRIWVSVTLHRLHTAAIIRLIRRGRSSSSVIWAACSSMLRSLNLIS